MADDAIPTPQSISVSAARNLATTTKTIPQMVSITPRWLLKLLPWVSVTAGTYRVNRTRSVARKDDRNPGDLEDGSNEYGEKLIESMSGHEGEPGLPETFADYAEAPREYPLSVVQTIVRLHTRVSDLYSDPINQLEQQLRLTIEGMKETQEWELINNREFGLLPAVAPSMRIQPRYGAPTPDDLDELLSLVWKQPAFFIAHPRAIAAFGRECTWRGVPPATIQMFGSPFITWRGVPLIPCDSLEVNGRSLSRSGPGTTNILLVRVGEKEQGVIGLHQPGIPGEVSPSLSVRLMAINQKAVASYLLTLYFSCAVLTDDALGVLENVEVGDYHDYAHRTTQA